MFPNSAKSSKFTTTVSNVPLFDADHSNGDAEIGDMRLFDHYIKSISTPEKSITDLPSYYGNGQQINQDPSGNKELYSFSIEFGVDEDYKNYSAFVRWWKWLRSGKISPAGLYKNFNINEINMHFMDNQKRIKYTEILSICAIQSISGLVTASDSATEMTFTASFLAQHFDIKVWSDYTKKITCIDTTEECVFAN